jgi:broad specificity phosphatase PhoE
MQPTRVLSVRHGDSHHRVDGVNGGPRACRGLTDLGREQVAGLRGRFPATHEITGPVTSCSSMISRAIETAEIEELTRIAARHAGQNVLIATHAEAVRASLITFGVLPIYRHFEARVSAASVTEWTTDDDPSAPWESSADPRLPVRWTPARLNDAAHAAHSAPAARTAHAACPARSATRR